MSTSASGLPALSDDELQTPGGVRPHPSKRAKAPASKPKAQPKPQPKPQPSQAVAKPRPPALVDLSEELGDEAPEIPVDFNTTVDARGQVNITASLPEDNRLSEALRVANEKIAALEAEKVARSRQAPRSEPVIEVTRPIARTTVPDGTPRARIIQPTKGSYDDHGEIRSGAKTGGTMITFVSNVRELRLKIWVPRPDGEGAELYYPTTILFNAYTFTTDEPAIIETLKCYPSFGGTQVLTFRDKPIGARESLFWVGGYPHDVAKKMKEDREGLVKEQGFHERDK